MSRLSYRTLRENVVREIRAKILRHELEPGVRIIEQDLSNELGVSRGPIREALRQLEQEGIIEYTRNVGCSVKKVTIQDLYEIYLLQSTYEILAVKLCDGNFDEKDIERMERLLEQMKSQKLRYEEIVAYDHMFHKIIVEKADSERMAKVWADLDYGMTVASYLGKFNEKETAKRQYAIHRELTEVCRTKNADAICKAISEHYRSSVIHFLKKEGMEERQFRFWSV